MSATVRVPWNNHTGWKTFDRGLLQTAYLLALDDGDGLARTLMDEYGMGQVEAIETAVAARICLREGIEP